MTTDKCTLVIGRYSQLEHAPEEIWWKDSSHSAKSSAMVVMDLELPDGTGQTIRFPDTKIRAVIDALRELI